MMINLQSGRSVDSPSKWIQLSLTALVLLAAIPAGGCRICADCEDLAYPAYGGAWQRTEREKGRVGSVFDPGGAKLASLIDREGPDQPDEIIRRLETERSGDSDLDPGMDDEDGDSDAADDSSTKDSRAKEADRLKDRKLEDIEDENEDELRKKSLDDIEVRIIPGRAPTMIQTKK
ncbi:hypothetical protein Poly51_46820 [Rubripirellula tenax]|uniref:Uncharacterized protein n=1 Tax=Rubripirellula tenax TaxID=2528015 RepID=A0A5C6EN72_9BACT|nr:hypothetical protein [Rubripirellula tenax]TWU48779.1 hypothetical protein Poly51_46820 [Rubripirellula tenax]